MSRICESWWWMLIAVGAFVLYGGLTPSHIRDEPKMAIASYVALAVSLIMCMLTLVAWFRRVRRGAN